MSSKIEDVRFSVGSEVDALRTVALRWANPCRLSAGMAVSLLSAPVRAQLLHNRWDFYDVMRVREQQERFADVLRAHGVRVLLLDDAPGVCSQHYTRDIAFCIDDTLFVACMATQYRRPEQAALGALLCGAQRAVRLERGRIEGGDVMLCEGAVMVGLGEATDEAGVAELRQRLIDAGSTRDVVPIPFTKRGVVHLDTKFNIVGPRSAVFSSKYFEPSTIRWFEKRFDLIDATDAEVDRLEINTFALGGGKVVMRETSERLAKRLEQRGLTPILVDYSEVTRWPGSFRCTTLPLERGD